MTGSGHQGRSTVAAAIRGDAEAVRALWQENRRWVGNFAVQYWDPEKAEGFFHAFSGWLIFVVSLFMLFLLHRVLIRISGKSAAGDAA